MLIFAQAVRDRFDGTAVKIDKISSTQVIEVGPRDKKKQILSEATAEGTCLLHSIFTGRMVYLVNGVCPLIDEHSEK